jgi:replicative DNA helicase
MVQDRFPFTDNLETALITGFLKDRKLWVRMHNDISLHYFNDKDMAKIFNIIRTFFNKYKEFPTEEVVCNIAEKQAYDDSVIKKTRQVFQSINLIKPQEVEYLYDECNKFIKNQKIKDAIISGIDLLEKDGYEEIESKIKEAVQWNNDINLGIEINHAKERYEELDKLSKNRIPWPWRRLNIINPGMLSKQLYMVASSSSVGKSIFLDNVAFYSWHTLKKNIVSITLELSELIKAKRMDAFGMKMEMNVLEERKGEVIKFYEDNKTENRLFIKEFPTGAATVKKDFMGYLYNLELYAGLHPNDIDLLIVDYAGIVKAHKVTGNMYQDGASVCEDLRALGVEYDFPVLTADQFNRTVVKAAMTAEELTEAVIGESFRKYQLVDWMLGLINTPEERAQGKINFKTLKDREGQKDLVLPMKISYPQLRIIDLIE